MKKPVPTCLSPSALALGVTLGAAVLAAAPAAARADCETALRRAEKSYQEGRIHEVFAVRKACEQTEATTAERIRAWALLAKAHLFEDELEPAVAAIAALVTLDPDFSPALDDPVDFARLVNEEKGRRLTVQVATVSKVDEPLREAPATVVVVTAEEIERRGYLDLEELLHDLPGLDISRGNGDVYSNVYLRGYRSDRSDRMLLLVDGVEQNDLHSNTAYISRQYPLSNVARVEVVYGPASTIYGANAFTGVISITTQAPAALIADGESLGVHVAAGGGSFATGFLDATVAGRTAKGWLSWSLTGRSFRSDEQDLSDRADWDYDASVLATLDYQQAMRIEGALAQALEPVCHLLAELFDTCEVVVGNDGEVVAIQPTPSLAEVARAVDQELFTLLQGEQQEFSDETDDWAIDAKVQIRSLTLGLQTWRRQEGTLPWYTGSLRAGSTRNVWTPRQTTLYARYSRPVRSDLELTFFSRFKQHETDGDSSLARFVTYANGAIDLVRLAVFESGLPSSLQEITFDQTSSQIRNEATLIYQPSRRFNLVGGIELRQSSVQLEFASAVSAQVPINEIAPYTARRFFETQRSSSKTEMTDLGIFAQVSYKPRDDFKIVAGARIDSNSVRNDEALLAFDRKPTGEIPPTPCLNVFKFGPFPCNLRTESVAVEDSGSVFNPRLALVYTRDDFVFKAIYAEAFKTPSNFQRFTREPGVRDFASSGLQSEKVRNFELGASWQPRKDIAVDFAAYEASYSNAVALKKKVADEVLENPLNVLDVFPIVGAQFDNLGRLRIRGAQLSARARIGRFGLFGNYTYTDPANLDPVDELGQPRDDVDELPIGDIANHRLNLGADLAWREKIGLGLRANWVGERKTGVRTTVAENPLARIDSYFVAHATLSYKGYPTGSTWQLVVENLFDTDYEHPGVQLAGEGFASVLPQPGRAVYLRLLYKR